jgi:polyether ionophore transport system permease protein
MTGERGSADRRAATLIAVMTARRAVRSGAVWGAVFGLLVLNEAVSYHTNFPTVASRETFAQAFGGNAGFAAVIGSGRRLDTIGGFVAWRVFGLLIIVGAIWGLLTATRLLRGEEDAGRWELLLSGMTTRRRATLQATGGLAAGFVVIWTLTAAFTLAAGSRSSVGFSTVDSLFYATAATASAAVFLAVGALASQLSPTRRQANGLAAAVLGVSLVIRMIADSGNGLGWLRWASPLGWIENLRPLTGSQPLALIPVALLVLAAAGAAVVVAGWRDVGTGVVVSPEAGHTRTRLLGGPAMLVVRLERWVALSWIAALALLAVIFGIVARSAAQANFGIKTLEPALGHLNGHESVAAVWIGYEYLFLAALLALAAAGQISAMRNEEASGQLDNLLARPLSRRSWLVGRLGFGVVLIGAAGLASGVGGWIGLATGPSDIGLLAMLQAGMNITAPALLVLGVGTLLYGLAPRRAMPILYALILWSFVVQIVGSTITTNRWLLDTAVLSHLGPVPATGLDWTAIAWLIGIGVIAAFAGQVAFDRRDLAGA